MLMFNFVKLCIGKTFITLWSSLSDSLLRKYDFSNVNQYINESILFTCKFMGEGKTMHLQCDNGLRLVWYGELQHYLV